MGRADGEHDSYRESVWPLAQPTSLIQEFDGPSGDHPTQRVGGQIDRLPGTCDRGGFDQVGEQLGGVVDVLERVGGLVVGAR